MSRIRRFNQGAKNSARSFILIDGTLGMPLHRKHEVIWSGSFQGFDNAVVDAVS